MPELKLGKLPDRTPIKLTVVVPPDLKQALDDYVTVYHDTYGVEEAIGELIPQMIATFLASDRGFIKARAMLGTMRAGHG